MPPIWLTNRGLNATICCLSQLCKCSRLTNWRFSFTTSSRKEEAVGKRLPSFVFLTLIQKWTGCSGLQPGCQWSNFSWPGIWFPSVGWIKPVASPQLFRDFWVLIWCTFSQTGLFQDVPLPQPGNLRESWKFVRCTCSQLGLFLYVP